MSELKKKVRCDELFARIPDELRGLFDGVIYPWEVLPEIGVYLKSLKLPDSFREVSEGVFVHEGATVAPTAVIMPPAVICEGAEIRHGAYIRGKVYVGRGCVVGNSTEIKNSLLFDGAKVPHYNYVGDSVLGADSHMGASAVASNLKADKSQVTVRGEESYNTGCKKLGAILGDGAEVGCGCILNPGTVVGRGASIYPALSVRGVVPEGAIMKGADNIVKRR